MKSNITNDLNHSKNWLNYFICRAKTNQILKRDPELAQLFIEWFEHENHVGGQDDPKKGKSLKGLEEFHSCEGDFLLNWKGRGFKTILDVLLVRSCLLVK